MASTAAETGQAASNGTRKAALSVSGMSCMGCVSNVTRAVRKMPGVSEVDVSLPRGRARVDFDPGVTDADAIAVALSAAGYPSFVEEGEDLSAQAAAEATRASRSAANARAWKRRAIIGAILWAPAEATHWIFGHGHDHAGHWLMWHDWMGLVIGTIILGITGTAFFQGAWAAAKRGTTDMDTLVSLGGGTAYFYSLVALLGYLLLDWPLAPLYFLESAGLFTLIATGHWLEARARDQAGSSIRALLDLSPPTALRVSTADAPAPESFAAAPDPVEVPADSLQLGDRVLIKPAMRVPADGVVVSGSGAVNESMLTGEPIPVHKQPGDEVIGGTVNTDGSLIVRVTAAGSQSTLAGVIRLVEHAQASKPPVQHLADRISAIFVPVVIGIAIVTAITWLSVGYGSGWDPGTTWGRAANATCSVLIIACPCALGLAVPTAIMVGTGRGARRGILLRDIDALQRAQRIDTAIFDKTGTLTQGRPQVIKVAPADGVDEMEVLRLASAAEMFSEHPLAMAVVNHAREMGVEPGEVGSFRNEPGLGVEATVDGRTLRVGHPRFAFGREPDEADEARAPGAGDPEVEAATVVEVVEVGAGGIGGLGGVSGVDGGGSGGGGGGGGRRLGRIYLADEPKPDAVEIVQSLRDMGVRVAMLTGDRRATGLAIARRLGIDEQDVFADVRPDGKQQVVERLKQEGRKVAMIGDGVNDAPALAAADLGIAIGGGTDAAKEAGSIVLVGDRLRDVAVAIRLSRQTMRKIKQNLFFAFVYNVSAIPLAAAGFLSPLIAAAAMAASDISVVGNALLLRRSKID